MDTLVNQLTAGLNIPQEKALEIIKTIVNYVENQHPVIKDLAIEISNKELIRHLNH